MAEPGQVAEVRSGAVAAGHAKYGWPKERTLIGQRIKRLDGPIKARGEAQYAYDISRPGMLYARILRSSHAHAQIAAIEVSAAEKLPGVKAVLVHAEPGKKLMYQGDEIAAVAAITEEIAGDALRLIAVKYEPLPPVATIEQALRPNAPSLFKDGNTKPGNVEENGSVDKGFEQAAHIVEASYSAQVITHVCLETHGCVCEWEGENLTAWVSTQAVHGTKQDFAESLKIPQNNVRVITDYMGGGFGSKFGADVQGVICAKLAKQAGAPVKLMLDRKEEHLAVGNRPSAVAKVRAGATADGKLVAFDAETMGTGGAGAGSGFPLPYIYVFPNRRRSHTDVYINAGQQRAMRAPGHPQGCFVTEVVMDDLAAKIGIDPLELRLKNLPPEAPDAQWGKYLRMGAEKFGWNKRHADGDPTSGPLRRGMGCAANRWGGGGRGTKAHAEILSDGSVTIRTGTQDIGTGTRTLIAIVAAETLGIPVDAIKVEIGDSNFPFSGGSGGSTTAASVMPAIRIVTGKAFDALAARIAPSLGVAADQLVAHDGRIAAKTDTSKRLAWNEACKRLGAEPVVVDAEWEPGLSASGTSGVQFAEVEVDVETGVARVTRMLCVQDAGLIVDPLTAESQCMGGIIGGIGYALFENRILDRNTACMVNPNMEWYLVAGHSDIPQIEIVLVDQPERGVIGLGEPPTVSTAAAVANAVSNAIGARIRNLPVTPESVLTAIAGKTGGTL